MHAKLFRFLIAASFPIATFCMSGYAQKPDSTRVQEKKISPAEYAEETPQDSAVIRVAADSLKKLADSTQVSFFYSDFEKLGKLNLRPNDTALTGFQNYDPLYKRDRFYATLGNYGQCYRTLAPVSPGPGKGFDYGIHTIDHYLFQNDSVKYYKVKKTYTELLYTQGAKKEQNFRAIFSRNIYRSFNLGFDFHVINAPGAYTRQQTNHVNFVLTSQFFTKDKRYGVIANLTINRLRNYENGGLIYDSLFEQNLESNRKVIPVNLADAQNRVRESGFFMKHYVNLTRHPRHENDTSIASRKRVDLGRLSYSFQYNRQIQNFIDKQPDSGFFPPPVVDTVVTYDSLTVKQISNEIIWSNPSFKPNKQLRIFQMEAGIRQQYSEVSLHGNQNFFRQYIPVARVTFTPVPSLKLEARGDYVFGDYNSGDISLRVKLSTILGKPTKNAGIITVTGDYIYQQPGWFYAHYNGNNYRWDTTWLKQGLISGGLNYAFKHIETGFNVSRINNYTYLDTSSHPQQFQSEFGFLKVYLNGSVDVWRFKFNPQLTYQTVQGSTVLHLPVFMGNLAVYYTQPLFKGAATLQPGLNFFYNTLYYADNYNPALRSFYLQDQKQIGNYLYMDVFINLKIQRARFFFAYTHFNATFMGYTYFTTPNYPMQDGAFKFGIAWRFHD